MAPRLVLALLAAARTSAWGSCWRAFSTGARPATRPGRRRAPGSAGSLRGVTIATPDYVRRAHAAGYAVRVWFSGGEESRRVYDRMLRLSG